MTVKLGTIAPRDEMREVKRGEERCGEWEGMKRGWLVGGVYIRGAVGGQDVRKSSGWWVTIKGVVVGQG